MTRARSRPCPRERRACLRPRGSGARAVPAGRRSWDGHSEHSRRDAVVNHLIEPLALLPGCDRGPAERPRGALGEGAGAGAQVAGALPLGKYEVLGAVHVDDLGGKVEQQGRVELAAVHRSVGVLKVVREVQGEHVDGEDAGLAGAQGGERLLVRVVAMSGENDEALDTCLLPGSEQVVHPAVQRFAADGRVAGERPLRGGVDPIFDRRGAQDLQRSGEVVSQALDDDGVATEREVGAVLFARSYRYEEAGIALKNETHLVGDECLEVQRRVHVALAACGATIAAAEWLHGSTAGWAWAAGAAGVAVTLLAVRTSRWPPSLRLAGLAAVALACLSLGATLVLGVLPVRRIECCWSDVRAGRLPQDSSALKGTLAAAVAEARAVITPFYVSLEARRQTLDGGSAVGSVLLDAVPAAPDRGRAVSARFEEVYGVALRFYTPGLAPHDREVFDYCPTECEHSDTLFSVQPVPPAQGDAKLAALRGTTERAAIALVAALLLACLAAPPGRWRWLVVLVAAWCAARAPVGSSLHVAELFSPAAFYRPVLGVFSASAGALMVLGVVALCAASALWRRGLARRWWNVVGAALLVLAAPYLVRYLGRGIAPPAGGVGFALWMSWEAAVATAAMALVLAAAALVRGAREPHRVPWTLPAACTWAAVAALGGLWLWSPYGAWPDWYTFVWLPALVGVLVPAPRRWAVLGIATVAGTAAALVTWGAAVEGRLGLAERDAQGLGRAADPRAVSLLERLGTAPPAAPPRTAGELYAWWLASPLAIDEYPASLAAWTRAGEPEAEIRLASMDLPSSLVAALVRSPETARGPRVERLDRSPGVHYVLVLPLGGAGADVLTVAVGPRTRLIPAARVARFLERAAGVEPPYQITLSPPGPPPARTSARVIWTRPGWLARGERRLELPDGVHHVHLTVDLRDPWALLVRGVLVVVVDAGALAACWIVSLLLAGGWRPRLPPVVAALRTSYRVRLAAALSAFVVLPVLLFAVWSFARLGDEARRAGDLLITQTLRDAAATAGALVSDRPAAVTRSIAELGDRLDADLWLFRDGVLAVTSAPVLGELGLVDPFLGSDAFVRLALRDELELTDDGRTAGRSIRVGYLVVRSESPQVQEILAAPQLLDDERVRQQQEDLALVLILATLAGLVAALYLAGLAARGLARPVAALRDAAGAVGRGAPLPSFPPGAPREFEPVISAFERMAADVTRSQGALEEARRRTAQVLANVATGVIAVDDGLRVTMANPRAAELLGAPLTPGDLLTGAAPAEWLVVWTAVREYLDGTTEGIVEREFAVGGRQMRVQLASLGPAPDGCGAPARARRRPCPGARGRAPLLVGRCGSRSHGRARG